MTLIDSDPRMAQDTDMLLDRIRISIVVFAESAA